MKILLKFFFTIIFLIIGGYIVYVETERYESASITLLKDLSQKQEMSLGSMLLGQTSTTMQDSKVLELYMRSNEMFNFIDQQYDLIHHYTSDKLDPVQRLYHNAVLSIYSASKKNLLKKYNDDLTIVFDEPSGTLSLSFIHTDPHIAKQILESIIKRADDIINQFSKENAQVALHFIEKQKIENKALFIDAIKQLIAYQNKHNTIDPNIDVERKITILASLESDLVKNEVEYNSKAKTYNVNGAEMRMLKALVENIKESIQRVKTELAGSNNKYNANVFEFELLKSEMVFNKEVYRQTLINQEELKIEVNQNAKHLVVVAKPTLADIYTYPNKLWDIFTLFIIIVLFYNIVRAIRAIIQDHND